MVIYFRPLTTCALDAVGGQLHTPLGESLGKEPRIEVDWGLDRCQNASGHGCKERHSGSRRGLNPGCPVHNILF
jgi:hypothetical protein